MNKKIFVFIIIIAAALNVFAQSTPELIHPFNMDFETGYPGQIPSGWVIPSYARELKYTAEMSKIKPYEGRYSLLLRSPENAPDDQYGSVMQSIDAKPYRGKLVRFRAAVKVDKFKDIGAAHLWLRVKLSTGQVGLFKMMEDEPIVLPTWDVYEITGRIDDDAEKINYGLLIYGYCAAWIDAASFEVINEDTTENLPPVKLTKNEIDNIAAFAGLYGYVRFFQRAFETFGIDWNRFALAGVEEVRKAANKDELIDKLKKIFLPIAPGIQIYDSKKTPSQKVISNAPANSLEHVALTSLYPGLKSVFDEKNIPKNIFETVRKNEGYVTQSINAAKFIGKKLRLESYIKIQSDYPFGQGQLLLEIERKNSRYTKREFLKNFTVVENQWKKFSVEIEVPDNAMVIKPSLVLIGDGKVWFDDVKLFEIDNGKEKELEIRNPGFEKEKTEVLSFGWIEKPESMEAGYTVMIDNKVKHSGKQSLMISSDPETMIKVPSLGETFSANIGSGITLTMPKLLFVDSAQTLPHSSMPASLKSSKSPRFDMNAGDRTSRIAITVIAWNILKHFNAYNHSEKDWDEALRKAVGQAAADNGKDEFTNTLRELVLHTNDCQARVWHSYDTYRYTFPFLMKWINGRLIITDIDTSKAVRLKPGYEILEINGEKARSYFKKIEGLIPGTSDAWKQIRAIAEFRFGKKGSKVKFKFRTTLNNTEEAEIERNTYMADLLERRPSIVSIFNPSQDYNDTTMTNKAVYIDLTRIEDKKLKDIVPAIANAKGIIFDLRGFANASENVLGFLAEDTIKSVIWELPYFSQPGFDNVTYGKVRNIIEPKKPHFDGKFVFLADEKTIGYAETILAIVKNYKLGTIIGKNTAGSPGEVFAFTLPGEYHISVTEILVDNPGGKDIYKNGIQPDIEIKTTLDDIVDFKDPYLKKSNEIIFGKQN